MARFHAPQSRFGFLCPDLLCTIHRCILTGIPREPESRRDRINGTEIKGVSDEFRTPGRIFFQIDHHFYGIENIFDTVLL